MERAVGGTITAIHIYIVQDGRYEPISQEVQTIVTHPR